MRIGNFFKKEKNDELKFLSASTASLIETSSRKSKIIVWAIMLFVICAVVWACFAEVDEIVRGAGKIIPSKHVQIIQNLEGGVVSEVFVKPGDIVEPGQRLIKIDNKRHESSLGENKANLNSLQARAVRLYAESNSSTFAEAVKALKFSSIPEEFLNNEETLFNKDKEYLRNETKMIREQMNQINIRTLELESRIKNLDETLELTKKEIAMTEPLLYSGAATKVDILRLRKEYTNTAAEIDSARLRIKENNAAVLEYKSKLSEVEMNFRSRSQKEYNQTMADIEKVSETITGVRDQVDRSEVVSPVKGVVKTIYINTVGGVIKPGMDIMEVVPLEDTLEVEAKIKPSDIAFIHEGQKALVRFTAFDFSIYGGMDAEVTHISPDTTMEQKEVYYIVRLQTDATSITRKGKEHKIIPGMVVSADIMTGRKTIMTYLLKPVLKTKQMALTER